MEGKEKAVSDWDIYGSDNAEKPLVSNMVFSLFVCEPDERRLAPEAA